MLADKEIQLKKIFKEIELDLPNNIRKIKFDLRDEVSGEMIVKIELLLKKNIMDNRKNILEINRFKDDIRTNFINNGLSFPYIYLA